jgi:hypothetical protein
MFSANENIQLRQHKRRIVQAIEATMSEDILDLGVNVMVMQVACQDPGCVPIETAIIIVFPASEVELIPGLPQSAGGSFKTKILKPMADVDTPDDVLDVLPPQFDGGRRTAARLALSLRDVLFAQIQQVAGNSEQDAALRQQLAEYLKASLDEYVEHSCVPPVLGESYPTQEQEEDKADSSTANALVRATKVASAAPSSIPTKGNFVLKRPSLDENVASASAGAAANPSSSVSGTNTRNGSSLSGATVSSAARTSIQSVPPPTSSRRSNNPSRVFDSVSRRRQQATASRAIMASLEGVALPSHSSGVRRVGCPCCDPDNPRNVVDQMMQL